MDQELANAQKKYVMDGIVAKLAKPIGYRADREPDASWYRPPLEEEHCGEGEIKITRDRFLKDMLDKGMSQEDAMRHLVNSFPYICDSEESYQRFLNTLQKKNEPPPPPPPDPQPMPDMAAR